MDTFEHPELGKLLLGARAPDPTRMKLWLPDYLRIKLPDPVGGTWSDEVTVPWEMMLNDTYGNCVAAAVGHSQMAFTASARTIWVPTNDEVMAFYRSQNPGTQDNGMDEAKAMEYWRTDGIAGHKLDAWADVSITNKTFIQQANDLFGPLMLGILLPLTAQSQVGKLWDVVGDGKTGSSAPGSWGGHGVPMMGYDLSRVTDGSDVTDIITWGIRQPMTWRFFFTYCIECHAPLSKDWTNAQGLAPSDFDYPSLVAALNALRN